MRPLTWRPAPTDFRNYRYVSKVVADAEVPPVKYLINPPVQDQKNIGSCVFNAITTAHEALQVIDKDIIPPIMLSRLFAYYQYREKVGEVNQDNGASGLLALKVLSKTGICTEETWPYNEELYANRPPAAAYAEAGNYTIQAYYQLESISDMIRCIAEGYGFVGGVSVYDSWDATLVEETGIIPLPVPSNKWLGGHYLYFCGYDMNARTLQFQNSWGTDWAYKSNYPGHGFIPFDYIRKMGGIGEFFTIRSTKP